MTTRRKTAELNFRQLVDQHAERIYNLALLKCDQTVLAEDVCQETFIRVYKGLPHFRQEAELSTWIYRIALNVCHTTMKRELGSRYREIHLEDPDAAELEAEDGNVEQILFRCDQQELLRKAISRLPGPQSDVITLHYLNEFKYAEVAQIMELPINTVKSHLRRGKATLRRILQEDAL